MIINRDESEVAFTLIVIKKERINAENVKKKLRLKFLGETKKFFDNVYNIAYKFYYNDFFKDKLKAKYLGFRCLDIEELGKCRLDFVYVNNGILDVNSLHIHFKLLNAKIYFQSREESVKKIAGFLRKINDLIDSSDGYISNNDKDNENLLKILGNVRNLLLNNNNGNREYTFQVSKYIYTSVYNLDKKTIKNWEEFAVNIWRLLYLRPHGVDEDISIKNLSRDNWGSSSFFINFYQPGSLVSLSTPYPTINEIYFYYKEWFVPDINDKTCDIEIKIELKKEIFGNAYNMVGNKYDMVPEYPPLRYLGLLSLEFVGFVEETLRYLYEEMLKISEASFRIEIKESELGGFKETFIKLKGMFLIFKNIPKTLFTFFNLRNLYYKTKNLEYLRLRSHKKHIISLMDNKMQQIIDENITRLTMDLFNVMLLMLSILSLIVIFIQVFQIIINWIFKVLS